MVSFPSTLMVTVDPASGCSNVIPTSKSNNAQYRNCTTNIRHCNVREGCRYTLVTVLPAPLLQCICAKEYKTPPAGVAVPESVRKELAAAHQIKSMVRVLVPWIAGYHNVSTTSIFILLANLDQLDHRHHPLKLRLPYLVGKTPDIK